MVNSGSEENGWISNRRTGERYLEDGEALEYDSEGRIASISSGLTKMNSNRSHFLRVYMVWSVLILLATAACATAALVLLHDDDVSSPPPAAWTLPGMAAISATRDPAAFRQILERLISSESFADPESAYSKALNWITYEDQMQVSPYSAKFVQRYVLAYFYYATTVDGPWTSCNPSADAPSCYFIYESRDNPPNGIPTTYPALRWLSGIDECNWAGVFCDKLSQVRDLIILGGNTSGLFPSGVTLLPYMQNLIIHLGSTHGELPSRLFEMKHLNYLQVSHQNVEGKLPPSLWNSRSLTRLIMFMNQLVGSIPSDLEPTFGLQSIVLSHNHMTGTIPSALGSLPGLHSLDLTSNNFHGTIPTTLGSAPLSVGIVLTDNNLSGTIPTELGQLNATQNIALGGNYLLSGEIPKELYNAASLSWLYLNDCNFTGTISTDIGKLKALAVFDVENNKFHGRIPTEIGEISSLLELRLNGNDLTGTMPRQICHLRDVTNITANCLVDPKTFESQIECPEGCCTHCCNASGKQCEAINLHRAKSW